MDQECSVAGCSKLARSRTWCGTHYARWRTTGSTELAERVRITDTLCVVATCTSNAVAKGLCNRHWRRNHLYGDPLASAPQPTVEERFWAKVDKTDTCWLWTGAISDTGYGAFRAEVLTSAHRYSYELNVGPIPDGLVLDHLCRNRACCNPEHLEAVTQRVNTYRGEAPTVKAFLAGVCLRGHDQGTYGRVSARKDGSRAAFCDACIAERGVA